MPPLAVREGLGVACPSRWVVKEPLERGELVRLRPLAAHYAPVSHRHAAHGGGVGCWPFIARRCLDEAP